MSALANIAAALPPERPADPAARRWAVIRAVLFGADSLVRAETMADELIALLDRPGVQQQATDAPVPEPTDLPVAAGKFEAQPRRRDDGPRARAFTARDDAEILALVGAGMIDAHIADRLGRNQSSILGRRKVLERRAAEAAAAEAAPAAAASAAPIAAPLAADPVDAPIAQPVEPPIGASIAPAPKTGQFTPDDDAALMALADAGLDHDEIARRLGRKPGRVTARIILLARQRSQAPTAAEIERLAEPPPAPAVPVAPIAGRLAPEPLDPPIAPAPLQLKTGPFTEAEDQQLMRLASLGRTHREIAESMARKVTSVATRLGVLDRRGREPSAAEIERTVDRTLGRRQPPSPAPRVIAPAPPRPEPPAQISTGPRVPAGRLVKGAPGKPVMVAACERNCMTCGKRFRSSAAGNRLCTGCRSKSDQEGI